MTQSYAAFQVTQPGAHAKRTAEMLNGDVVSDSESDSATEYINLKSLSDERARRILSRKRKAIARRVRRLKSKAVAEKNFLGRKKNSRVSPG